MLLFGISGCCRGPSNSAPAPGGDGDDGTTSAERVFSGRRIILLSKEKEERKMISCSLEGIGKSYNRKPSERFWIMSVHA